MWILTSDTTAGEAPLTLRLLPGAVKTLGRAPQADFIVEATLVSRLHCRFVAGKAGLEVEDLRSTNGTFVNDQRVTRATLGPGDVVRVGELSLQVSRP
ncbi:MAG TPA: FHA domain-containing protein [Vicinamibacterales bacterium]|nr:FHA domain-containing protein [Vicinamibacterales bacterium]